MPQAAEPAPGQAGGSRAGVAQLVLQQKAGESQVDIDHLVKEMKEESPLRVASIEAMADLIGSLEAAENLPAIAAMDIVVQRFGLRPGAAIDLEEFKPNGEEKWDLDRETDFNEVQDLIAMEQPWLVTSSPPCTTSSPLRQLSNFKRLPKVVEEEETLGKQRLKRSIACCRQQDDQGGYFLHEHPRESTSWDEDDVVELEGRDNVFKVNSQMCKFNMMMQGDDGQWRHVRKETTWMTQRSWRGSVRTMFQEQNLIDMCTWLVAAEQKLLRCIPRNFARQRFVVSNASWKRMEKDYHISNMEGMVGGPVPDDNVEQIEQFFDATFGAALGPVLVKAAREEELKWIHQEGIYVRVPARECEGTPLMLKWVNVNKMEGIVQHVLRWKLTPAMWTCSSGTLASMAGPKDVMCQRTR